MKALKKIIDSHNRTDLPGFKPGDTLRVHLKIREGDKERVQMFEGVCIGRSGSRGHETVTVRKVSFGVGVERIFPIASPRVEKIEVVAHGRVRRAKLNYLRQLSGKAARIKERLDLRGTKDVKEQPAATPPTA